MLGVGKNMVPMDRPASLLHDYRSNERVLVVLTVRISKCAMLPTGYVYDQTLIVC